MRLYNIAQRNKMLEQQLNTIATLLFSKWINTGDRILDTTIIGTVVLLMAYVGSYLKENWRDYINLCLFYYNRMHQHPLDLKKCSYVIDFMRFDSISEFYDKTSQSSTRLWYRLFNTHLAEKGHKIRLTGDDDIRKYMMMLVNENNMHPLRERKSGNLLCSSSNSSIYPIAVSKYGNVVYYNYSDNEICSFGTKDRSYINTFIWDYIMNAAIHKSSHIEKSTIYVPKFESDRMALKSLGEIHKKKTFDTLYYPQKSELVLMLEKFMAKTMYPAHIPMDNKLGILLYGPPGTGKTGTISAIANMLGRSIIVINFAEVRTCEQLDQILKADNNSRVVYVFDEFDCVLDVISGSGKAQGSEAKEDKQDWGSMLMYAEGDERKKILDMMREGRGRSKNAAIDMAYLLQKLDGLESAEDRIIVATTNNPDKINPALLRPGRFDIKICLGLCTPAMIADIITNFYQGGAEMRSRVLKAKLPGNTYSPLQLINMAIQARDFETVLSTLTRNTT